MTPVERETFRQQVIQSRRARGLPDHVEDPGVLALTVRFLEGPKPSSSSDSGHAEARAS